MCLAGCLQQNPHASRCTSVDGLPDPVCTPGLTNPNVTQDNIHQTICKSGFTSAIRPPESYTEKLKMIQIIDYGYNDTELSHYEEDHLISLENGGHPMDPRNLFPEPYNTRVAGVIMGAHQKDVVEGFIHDEICYDVPGSKKNSYIPATTSITLKRGQEILATDWYACYESIKKGKPCR